MADTQFGASGAPATRAALARRLLEITGLQIEAFAELHDDGTFAVERVRALQVLVRSLAALEDLFKRMGETDETFAAGSGDVLDFRNRLTQGIDRLGEDGADGQMAGSP
jgi:hypothetical protein